MQRRRILLCLISDQNEFQLHQAADARRAAAAAADLDLDIAYGGGNAIQQIHQAFEFIHAPEEKRPSAILMEPVSGDGLERLARNALRAGIGWVSINRRSSWIADLRREFPGLPATCVTSDQISVGRIEARQARVLLPSGGSALCIQGPPQQSAARERRQGLDEVLVGVPITLTSVDAQWTEESGELAMQSWLRLRTGGAERLDLVICQNDDMAVGARRILHQQARTLGYPEWRNVPFIGVDGLPEGGKRLVDLGELAATVVNPSNTGPAIEMLARWFTTGQQPPEVLVLPAESYPTETELARRVASKRV
jgi:ABC-type sugar transport system substrate-binding protein